MFKFNRPYVKNKGQDFAPVYLPSEDYSFYCNFDEPINDANFSGFELWIIDSNGNQIVKIPQPLEFINTSIYTYIIYISNFVFPTIKTGYYYFQIYDSIIGDEKLRSNVIIVSSDCVYTTTTVKFRHNDQIYGYRFDLLPDFYIKMRLPIAQIKSVDIRSERDQYRQSSGARTLRNSKSFRDMINTLEFYWANDEDFEAVSAMLEMDEIYIAGNKLMDISQIKIEKPTEQSNQSKATFEVIVNNFDLDYNLIENYGEFILWGGGTYNILNTFVQG